MLHQFVQPKTLTAQDVESVLDRANITDESERQELAPKLLQLVGPIPSDFQSQYLTTYADRVAAAKQAYKNTVANMDKTEQDYADMLAGAKRRLRRALAVANTYRNDLENYAYALLIEWKKTGTWIG